MRIEILTLFPEVFEPFLSTSIVGRARAKGLVSFGLTDFREFARDNHRSVDDKPYGGGPGMLLKCEPIFAAVRHVESGLSDRMEVTRILLTPQGRVLDQALAWDLSERPAMLLICGRYEGFDERIRIGLDPLELSIGDYVLSGGEAAATAVIDAVTRLLPGALGDERSAADESFTGGLLEYPQYTRPAEFEGLGVPEVLLSGNHGEVARWRREQRLERMRSRRPNPNAGDDSGV